MKLGEKNLKPHELDSWCRWLIGKLEPKTLILLFGELGVGKTFFVGKLMEAMGGEKSLSPTYSLINHYQTGVFENIYHVDLYRLKDDEDLESTGFWDLFWDPKALIVIEWAQRLNFSYLPLDWKKIQIHIQEQEDPESRYYLASLG